MAEGRYLPEYGMPLDRWVVAPLMRLLPNRKRMRIEETNSITDVVRPLEADGGMAGVGDWQWVHSPGHTPGHVAYFRRSDGLLISGDAVVTVDLNSIVGVLTRRQRIAPPPRYSTWNWPAAVRSVATLAALKPRLLAPGHGEALRTGAAYALRSLAERLECPRIGPLRNLRGAFAIPRYGARARYRPPPPAYARLQWVGHVLTRPGASPGYVVTLEVPGRRSLVLRRTNLNAARAMRTGRADLATRVRRADTSTMCSFGFRGPKGCCTHRPGGPLSRPTPPAYRTAWAAVSRLWEGGPDAAEDESIVLAESTVRVLSMFAGGRGLVVSVEDVQWADPETYAVLEHLARTVDAAPIVASVTARTSPTGRDRTAGLTHTPAGSVLELTRLDASEQRAMINALLGSEPPADVVQFLRTRRPSACGVGTAAVRCRRHAE